MGRVELKKKRPDVKYRSKYAKRIYPKGMCFHADSLFV
jgi:hypothetical protein